MKNNSLKIDLRTIKSLKINQEIIRFRKRQMTEYSKKLMVRNHGKEREK